MKVTLDIKLRAKQGQDGHPEISKYMKLGIEKEKVVLLEAKSEEGDQNHKGPVQWDMEPQKTFMHS
jgi:hypothetical protein